MTNSDHLLRLARIVEHMAIRDSEASTLTRNHLRNHVRNLVRDLEAAESQPAPRTITRAQLDHAVGYLRISVNTFDNDAEHIALLWGLTVEDA